MSLAMAPRRMTQPKLRKTSRGMMVVGDPTMRAALDVIERVAGSACNVLVTGESGTGKELVVAALHDASPRREAPLVAVNCGAIPENLVENELFGHARGAFTGAATARPGLVAAAEGGTLFLDEVGELPLAVQVKLLRLIQAREYTVVGESRTSKADVRLVAATHRDLAAEVRAGRFREDLFFRLNVIHVELPALRNRPQDIRPLAQYFLRHCAERVGRRDVRAFSDDALALLEGHEWPGNVRALENAVERSVLLATGTIIDAELLRAGLPRSRRVSLLPLAGEARASVIAGAARGAQGLTIDLRAEVDAYETTLVRKVLESVGWNRSHAAARLGIHRTTLIEMMKRKGLLVRPVAA